MKNSSVYQDLKIQFLYFFVAYELLKTNNLNLFVVIFLLVVFDLLYNSKNVFFMPEFLTEKNWKNDFITNKNWIFGLLEESDELFKSGHLKS